MHGQRTQFLGGEGSSKQRKVSLAFLTALRPAFRCLNMENFFGERLGILAILMLICFLIYRMGINVMNVYCRLM